MIRLGPAELLDRHPHVTVLTLDFFDTLVTRSVAQPTHVFAVMEQRLVETKGERWSGFAVRRVLAERSARGVKAAMDEHADVTLDEILRELAVLSDLSMVERAELSLMEQAAEIEMAVRVPFGAELMDDALARGLRVLVVSDNYMPASHLVRMAAAAGITLEESQVIVSCEHGAMKHDGSLWARVLEVAGVGPGEILHVGDLEDADGEIPRRHGISTHVVDAMRRSHREPLNTSPAVLPLSRIEAANRDRSAGTQWDAVANMARGALALVVAGQVLDVERVTRERSTAGVHFTSRDGYLAHEVYVSMCDGDRNLPKPSYTEISRSITWRALLTEVNEQTAHRFVGDDERLSVRALETRFGCPLDTGFDPSEVIDAVAARGVIVRNAGMIEEACRSLRVKLMEHLDATGVTQPGHHVLMDLGWSGSVVADLAQLVREERGSEVTFEGRLTGLYWDATANRPRIPLHGLAFDEFLPMDDNVRMLGMIRLFESLITAPHGSVVDYVDGSAVHNGVHDVPMIINSSWDELAGNVVTAAGDIVRGVHPLVGRGEVTGQVVRAAMMQIGHTPTLPEVGCLMSARHETAIDHAGGGSPLISVPPRNLRPEDIRTVYDNLLRHHWAQGALTAWSTDPETRWIADEVRLFGPMLAPQWVAR